MISNHTKNAANAVGGKTARACDSCVKKRARWYCAADDAFLCQACDASVHSANPLARRHERVRLKSASSVTKGPAIPSSSSSPPPQAATWFTKKARSPRGGWNKKNNRAFHDVVPEVSADDQVENYEEEQQLIYRVPVFDSELCRNDAVETRDAKTDLFLSGYKNSNNNNNSGVESCLNGFFPSDMELAEFAADVESLLGRGLENESFAMEELGLVDGYKETEVKECSLGTGRSSVVLKVEDEDEEGVVLNEAAINRECDIGYTEAPFELNFDYDSHAICGGEDDNKVIVKGEEDVKETSDCYEKEKETKRKDALMLRLDYEAVSATWGDQGQPWTAGDRPEIDPNDECWPACMGTAGVDPHQHPYDAGFIPGGIGSHAAFADGGREARVSRYREKRRTRLFSKKIRYEVRKLNAEKRPRMKGRFVKRASFAGPAAFPLLTK